MQNDHLNNPISSMKNWLWSDCKLVLRRTNPNNKSQQSYQNLQAQVELESEDIEQPFIPIFQFKKTFFFNNNKGFIWKKGIALPPLIVKLQKSYFQLLQQDEELIMIYCELTVAYPKRKESHFFLQQIRSIGQKRKQFSAEGEVEFNGIVLKQCSHQKSNSKFSFVVSICARSQQQNKIILKTLISTAFYTQNSRINRKKVKKSKYLMKLISPNQFLKPIIQKNQIQIQQNYTKQKIIQYLKTCNEKARELSLKHPFYIIYHFSKIFKVYYNSRQVKDLHQLLQKTAPEIYQKLQDDKLKSIKNAYVNYQVKKTKKIKKKKTAAIVMNSIPQKNIDKMIQENNEGQNQQIQKYSKQHNNLSYIQNQLHKYRQKLIISAKLKQGQALQKKLLMITFQNDIIDFIETQIQNLKSLNQEQQNKFKQQLNYQINRINKIFEKWTRIYMKIDLLKNQPFCVCWKSLERQSFYEAYKTHYYVAYDKLLNKKSSVIINKQSSFQQEIY